MRKGGSACAAWSVRASAAIASVTDLAVIAVPSCCAGSHRIGPRLCDLRVLMGGCSRHANRTDDPTVGNDGKTPFREARAKGQGSQSHTAACERILECFRRAAELNRSPCLVFGDPAGGKLRVVQPMKYHQIAARVDNCNCDRPSVFYGLLLGFQSCPLRRVELDVRTVRRCRRGDLRLSHVVLPV